MRLGIPTMCNPIYWAKVHLQMSKDTFGMIPTLGLCSVIVLIISWCLYYFSWMTIGISLMGVGIGSIVVCVYWGMNYLALFKLPKYKQNQMISTAVSKSQRELAVRILDLDGTLHDQTKLIEIYKPEICDARQVI